MTRIAYVLLVLVSLFVLASCGTLQIGVERTAVSPATAAATATTLVTETVLPTRRTTVEAVPTPAPTPTIVTPSPVATTVDWTPTSSDLTSTVAAASGPTATVAAIEPRIISFGVVPTEVEPGDVVTLSWEARGDRATICPSARFVLFTPDSCWRAPLSGVTTFTIPLEARGNRFVDFLLTVNAEGSADPAMWQISVAFKCQKTWFFSDEPQAGICPVDPIKSYAAAQRFERGTMIWLEEPGRYVILEDEPLYDGDVRKRVTYVQDPLDIVRDTSDSIVAPDGFYAPVSGFGLVWRGDVTSSPGYREALGWALAPEFGYDTILQCDDALPSGGRSWQTCYLQGPDGEVVVLDPLERWYLWDGG